ncbi:MAG TPA: PEGA domain-containing protein [Sandaracinaceae bacterium LLY-WYZ-13_1]|nr:PEGA domain-containing protein [Sandaracinaceae bacterium LLY-WYZ-13_1]
MTYRRPSPLRAGCIALLLAALAPAGLARADAAAEARFHDRAARRHYEAGRYEAAVREFMIEQRIAPNPNIVFNIALCFQHMGEAEEAYMQFAEYLEAEDDDEDRRARARRALEELRSEVALVEVRSQPAGAAIYIDRRELGRYGTTPRTVALPEGEHRIWVEIEGHRPAERTVTLSDGRRTELDLRPEQILGRLRLSVQPEAAVRVLDADGELVWEGTAPVDTRLPPGTYRVEAHRGTERWSDAVRIRAEATTDVDAELSPPTGELTVVANEPGSLIRLNGEDAGFTPQILSVPVGEHTLRVSGEEVQPYEGSIEVEEAGRLWVNVSLSPAPRGPFSDEVWIMGGVSLGLLAAAGVFTGLTAWSHSEYQTAQQNAQAYTSLAEETNRFAVTSDLLWLTGGAAAVATLVTLVVNLAQQARPSTATTSRSAP